MKYSETALMVLAAKESGLIKTNAQFWSKYDNIKTFIEAVQCDQRIANISKKLENEFDNDDTEMGIVCAYDEKFPTINSKVKNKGDRPFLLFYKGDLELLSNLNKNVAVIGLINPTEEIEKREIDIVKRLVEKDLRVVSGLAKGCDTIAHEACLEWNGKTVAILPSQICKVHPTENRDLAEAIVAQGGLLISEYYKDANSKNEAINRFIERDRLQAMFSKAVILIASYRKGEGDSGSRHAMEAARKYEIERFAMYNDAKDGNNAQFGLNKDLISEQGINQVKVLIPSSIDYLEIADNKNLTIQEKNDECEQLSLL